MAIGSTLELMSFLRSHWNDIVQQAGRAGSISDKLIQQIDNKRVSDLEGRKLNAGAEVLQIGFML